MNLWSNSRLLTNDQEMKHLYFNWLLSSFFSSSAARRSSRLKTKMRTLFSHVRHVAEIERLNWKARAPQEQSVWRWIIKYDRLNKIVLTSLDLSPLQLFRKFLHPVWRESYNDSESCLQCGKWGGRRHRLSRKVLSIKFEP